MWDFLVVQPIAFIIRSLYNLTTNYGVAIILFAVVAKLFLLWFAYKGKRGMLQQQRLQPKIKELQKKYGTDKAKMQQEQQKLYQSEGVSLFGGCLWMLIPFPIIIALYGAVRRPLQYIWELSTEKVEAIADKLNEGIAEGAAKLVDTTDFIYELKMADMLSESQHLNNAISVVPEIAEKGLEPLNFSFLGLDLAARPSEEMGALILIPLLSALTSFLSVYLTQKFSGRPPAAGNSQLLMYVLGPGISLWLGFSFPAALGVYWIAQNVLGIPQEYFLTKHFNKVLDAEDAAKASREERKKAAEAAQKEEDRQRRAERIAAKNQKHKPKRYKLNKPPSEEPEQEGE
ncbi:MAG: membrane protein insertase YidC [Oscillospiraceae bacterium]|nr:membrane protein insertase YidC [Oscillospiraceae bacterium]